MEDKKSPNKIKKEKQIFVGRNDLQMRWGDIKHLQLEDNDVIYSGWVEDDAYDYHGYWHCQITRMIEETDEEYQTRLERIERDNKWAKERRYESYLKLKAEFENETAG